MTDDDGRQPRAIGHQSDYGDLKTYKADSAMPLRM